MLACLLMKQCFFSGFPVSGPCCLVSLDFVQCTREAKIWSDTLGHIKHELDIWCTHCLLCHTALCLLIPGIWLDSFYFAQFPSMENLFIIVYDRFSSLFLWENFSFWIGMDSMRSSAYKLTSVDQKMFPQTSFGLHTFSTSFSSIAYILWMPRALGHVCIVLPPQVLCHDTRGVSTGCVFLEGTSLPRAVT